MGNGRLSPAILSLRMIVILRDSLSGGSGTASGDAPHITMIPLYDWPAPPGPVTPGLMASSR